MLRAGMCASQGCPVGLAALVIWRQALRRFIPLIHFREVMLLC